MQLFGLRIFKWGVGTISLFSSGVRETRIVLEYSCILISRLVAMTGSRGSYKYTWGMGTAHVYSLCRGFSLDWYWALEVQCLLTYTQNTDISAGLSDPGLTECHSMEISLL